MRRNIEVYWTKDGHSHFNNWYFEWSEQSRQQAEAHDQAQNIRRWMMTTLFMSQADLAKLRSWDLLSELAPQDWSILVGRVFYGTTSLGYLDAMMMHEQVIGHSYCCWTLCMACVTELSYVSWTSSRRDISLTGFRNLR